MTKNLKQLALRRVSGMWAIDPGHEPCLPPTARNCVMLLHKVIWCSHTMQLDSKAQFCLQCMQWLGCLLKGPSLSSIRKCPLALRGDACRHSGEEHMAAEPRRLAMLNLRWEQHLGGIMLQMKGEDWHVFEVAWLGNHLIQIELQTPFLVKWKVKRLIRRNQISLRCEFIVTIL